MDFTDGSCATTGLRVQVTNYKGTGSVVLGLNRASTPVAPATKTRSDGTTYVDPKIEHGFYMRGNTGVAPWYDGS